MNKKRNLWTTKNNCFGYAFGIPQWLLVSDYSDSYQDFVSFFLSLGKPVTKKEMQQGKEYIAYKYCAQDFHFMRREKTGHWRHKMGWSNVQTISQKDVFAPIWCNNYNSKTYFIEVTEQTEQFVQQYLNN